MSTIEVPGLLFQGGNQQLTKNDSRKKPGWSKGRSRRSMCLLLVVFQAILSVLVFHRAGCNSRSSASLSWIDSLHLPILSCEVPTKAHHWTFQGKSEVGRKKGSKNADLPGWVSEFLDDPLSDAEAEAAKLKALAKQKKLEARKKKGREKKNRKDSNETVDSGVKTQDTIGTTDPGHEVLEASAGGSTMPEQQGVDHAEGRELVSKEGEILPGEAKIVGISLASDALEQGRGQRAGKGKNEARAYATLIREEAMLEPALVLAQSIRLTLSKYHIVVMLEDSHELDEVAADPRLLAHFTLVKRVPAIWHPLYEQSYGRLNAWNLTEYGKVIYLEPDMMVLTKLDHLFKRPCALSAAADLFATDKFSADLMLLQPAREVFLDMLARVMDEPSHDGTDQGFLNSYFPYWYIQSTQVRLRSHYNLIYHFTPDVSSPPGMSLRTAHAELGPISVVNFNFPGCSPWLGPPPLTSAPPPLLEHPADESQDLGGDAMGAEEGTGGSGSDPKTDLNLNLDSASGSAAEESLQPELASEGADADSSVGESAEDHGGGGGSADTDQSGGGRRRRGRTLLAAGSRDETRGAGRAGGAIGEDLGGTSGAACWTGRTLKARRKPRGGATLKGGDAVQEEGGDVHAALGGVQSERGEAGGDAGSAVVHPAAADGGTDAGAGVGVAGARSEEEERQGVSDASPEDREHAEVEPHGTLPAGESGGLDDERQLAQADDAQAKDGGRGKRKKKTRSKRRRPGAAAAAADGLQGSGDPASISVFDSRLPVEAGAGGGLAGGGGAAAVASDGGLRESESESESRRENLESGGSAGAGLGSDGAADPEGALLQQQQHAGERVEEHGGGAEGEEGAAAGREGGGQKEGKGEGGAQAEAEAALPGTDAAASSGATAAAQQEAESGDGTGTGGGGGDPQEVCSGSLWAEVWVRLAAKLKEGSWQPLRARQVSVHEIAAEVLKERQTPGNYSTSHAGELQFDQSSSSSWRFNHMHLPPPLLPPFEPSSSPNPLVEAATAVAAAGAASELASSGEAAAPLGAPSLLPPVEEFAFVTTAWDDLSLTAAAGMCESYNQYHRNVSDNLTYPMVLVVYSSLRWKPYLSLYDRIIPIDRPQLLAMGVNSSVAGNWEFILLKAWSLEPYKRVAYVDPYSFFVDSCRELAAVRAPFAATPHTFQGDQLSPSLMIIQPHNDTYMDMLSKLQESDRYPVCNVTSFVAAYFHTWFRMAPLHRLPKRYSGDIWLRPALAQHLQPWKILVFDRRNPPWLVDHRYWPHQDVYDAAEMWREGFCRLAGSHRPFFSCRGASYMFKRGIVEEEQLANKLERIDIPKVKFHGMAFTFYWGVSGGNMSLPLVVDKSEKPGTRRWPKLPKMKPRVQIVDSRSR